MRKSRSAVLLGAAAVVASAVLFAASPPAHAAGTPQKGGTLTVGFPSDSKTLAPTFSVPFTERQVLYLIYNMLVRFGPDFSIQPELAESWSIEGDGSPGDRVLDVGCGFGEIAIKLAARAAAPA